MEKSLTDIVVADIKAFVEREDVPDAVQSRMTGAFQVWKQETDTVVQGQGLVMLQYIADLATVDDLDKYDVGRLIAAIDYAATVRRADADAFQVCRKLMTLARAVATAAKQTQEERGLSVKL